MVRVAIIALTLTHSLADEDAYHHAQLLQTKVSPHKVAIDSHGVKDHVTLFQSSLHKKLYQSSRKIALKKIMAFLEGRKKKGDWSSSSSSWSYGDWSSYGLDESGSSYDWSSSEEMPHYMEAEAKKYYGDDVDLEKFWECAKTPPDTDSESWYPDPNKGMRTVTEYMDTCVGITNSLTQECKAEYGPEVGLFDCMMCGMNCQCESPSNCDLACHRECMSFDAGAWQDESSFDSSWSSSSYSDHEESGECKLFYGDDVNVEQCEACGEECWEKGISGIDWEDTTYAKERAFWEEFGGCSDVCMGVPNLVTEVCKDKYGDDVDVFECINCGMVCECDLEECEGSSYSFDCHNTCMRDNWMVWSSSTSSSYWSSYPSSTGDWGSYSEYSLMTVKDQMAKARANFQKKVKSVQAVKFPKQLVGDATDLMQTSKRLKK